MINKIINLAGLSMVILGLSSGGVILLIALVLNAPWWGSIILFLIIGGLLLGMINIFLEFFLDELKEINEKLSRKPN